MNKDRWRPCVRVGKCIARETSVSRAPDEGVHRGLGALRAKAFNREGRKDYAKVAKEVIGIFLACFAHPLRASRLKAFPDCFCEASLGGHAQGAAFLLGAGGEVADWKTEGDARSGIVRANVHAALKPADAFAHSTNSDTATLGLDRCEAIGWNAFTLILHLEKDFFVFAPDRDLGGLAAGMAMYIRQGFLDDAKYRQFDFG